MARDFLSDENGQLVIDPDTHDIAWVTGFDEIAQRIRTTLLIHYGEMPNLAPKVGTDYTNFLGKKFNPTLAAGDMTATIKDEVPEVESVNSINFKKLPHRGLLVTFKCTANLDGKTEEVEGGANLGN